MYLNPYLTKEKWIENYLVLCICSKYPVCQLLLKCIYLSNTNIHKMILKNYGGSYSDKSHVALIFQQSSHNDWVSGIEIGDELTREVIELHAHIHAWPVAFILDPCFIIQALKFSSV